MRACARCGQENPEGFRFCGACGASLEDAEAPREVRKTVTVVFCDLTGSTALGERLDPETLRATMRRTGLSQHTLKAIRDGRSVRVSTLRRLTKSLER